MEKKRKTNEEIEFATAEKKRTADALLVLERDVAKAIPMEVMSLGVPYPLDWSQQSEMSRLVTVLDTKHMELIALLGNGTYPFYANELASLFHTTININIEPLVDKQLPTTPHPPRDYVIVGRQSIETRIARCRSVVLDAWSSNYIQRRLGSLVTDLTPAVYRLQQVVDPLHQTYSRSGSRPLTNNCILAMATISVATHRLLSWNDHQVYHALLTLKEMKIVHWPPGLPELIALYVAL